MLPDFHPHAVWPYTEKKPYRVLPKGVHEADSLDEVWQRFEHEFSSSSTRPVIAKAYGKLLQHSCDRQLHVRQWVCGSFTTDKLDPDDIDLCSIATFEHMNTWSTGTEAWAKTALKGRELSKKDYKAHTFFITYYPISHRKRPLYVEEFNYWRYWFGHTRELFDSNGSRTELRFQKGIVCLIVGNSEQCPPLEEDEWLGE